MPPVNHDALQDMYELMWWIRTELEHWLGSTALSKGEIRRWQKRYDSICRVAEVAFKHIPLKNAVENYMEHWEEGHDYPEAVQDMLSNYRETCNETKS